MNRRLLSVFTLFLLTVFAQPSWGAKLYKLRPTENVLLNNYIQSKIDQKLTVSEIDALIKDISQSGIFQMVYAEVVQNDVVEIKAQESRRIATIGLEGNDFFETRFLQNEIELKSGDSASSLQIKRAIETIKKLYSDAGFYDTKVTYSSENTANGIAIRIDITEGRSCRVENISIFSRNKTLNKKSRDLLAEFKNVPFKQSTKNEIQKKIQDFFTEQRYLTADIEKIQTQFNPEKSKVKINISIKDPTLFEFIFFGNKFFSHFDLIKKSKIGGKFLYLSNSSSELADNIRDHYKDYGFPNAKVEYSERYIEKLDKKVIVVKINEGRRVRISKVRVIGKLSKPRSYYQKELENYLSDASKNIYFVRKNINLAIESLILKLKNKGHLLAEALPPTVKYDKAGNVTVTVQIDEGMLTYIRQILFRGSRGFSNLTLRDKVGLESNAPLDLGKIQDSFARLEGFYKERGFLEFRLKNRDASVIKYNQGQPFADVVYEIDEGPEIKVRAIQVKGNSKTMDYVILRELAFAKGDILTQSKVQRSIDLLEKTGLFSEVRIETLEKDSEESNRTIQVFVGERQPGLFSTGTGINNELDLTFRGYLGVVYSNLGGKARAISTRLDLKYSTRVPIYYLENRLAFGYYEPYLFKNRIRGRASLVRDELVFSLEDRQVNGKSEQVATILSKNELNLNAEKEFSDHFKLNYRAWGFSNQTIFDRSAERRNAKTINIGTTGPTLEFDYRNDKFLPTSGTYTRWEFEYSDPLLGSSRDNGNEDSKAVNFFKTTLATNFYIPLSRNRRYIWANSLRGGFLKNVSSRSASGVPAIKSFFLGGNSTIRGFQNVTERIPNVQELCEDTGSCELADFFVPEESTFYLVKSEFRFPIFENIGGLLFYDGGAVHIKGVDLSDPFRESVGAGVRIETPVGAFVIELGFKLDRKKDNELYPRDEEAFAFHFALGSF